MFLGESVTFTCAAGAFSGWEYLWYHDGKEIQAPKTDVYTIDSVDHSYSGEYSCKAKRGKGPFYTEESETQSLLVSGKNIHHHKLQYNHQCINIHLQGPFEYFYIYLNL